ncbi:MAG TPA: TolC family protein, partial [Gemmataceae bacterium]|nr:TolC family protein [Gemmataceae bacterium]
MRKFGCLAVFWMAAMAQSAALAGPPTLDHPGKKCRFISLAEARAIALDHSRNSELRLFPDSGFESDGMFGDTNPIRVLAAGKAGSKSIVITGISCHPRPATYERNVNQLLLNLENAYWNLYGSYWQLHSREQSLRLAYETWKITTAQHRVGRISNAAVAQAEGQYNLFRSQCLQAIDTVLDNQRQLFAMMGLPIEEG